MINNCINIENNIISINQIKENIEEVKKNKNFEIVFQTGWNEIEKFLNQIKQFWKIGGRKEAHILMLGLDKEDKTTILYQLKNREAIKTNPTLGFNVENLDFKDIYFTIWDVGGQDKLRTLWKNYYQMTDAVIFVVGSTDRDRIKEATEELLNILADENLKDCIILVLANKQDLKKVFFQMNSQKN